MVYSGVIGVDNTGSHTSMSVLFPKVPPVFTCKHCDL